jgi:Family of unknown function (DUF5681)
MTVADNAAPKQRGRPFQKGQSGNPAGMPKGTRHKATRAIEALLEGEAEALTRKAVEMALQGDGTALRLCLERLCPPRKDRPVSFELPPISNASHLPKAAIGLLQAVADAEVTPEEAGGVMRLIDGAGKAIEVGELAERIAALEGRIK